MTAKTPPPGDERRYTSPMFNRARWAGRAPQLGIGDVPSVSPIERPEAGVTRRETARSQRGRSCLRARTGLVVSVSMLGK